MTGSDVTQAPTPGLEPAAIAALQAALASEHAALWCDALAVAFLPSPQVGQARSDADAHRALRGALEQRLTDADVRPVPALPAYTTPQRVTDGTSAAALLVVAETDALGAWRSVLERTSDRALRAAALRALAEGTLRCARWRAVVGPSPTIPTFPGR